MCSGRKFKTAMFTPVCTLKAFRHRHIHLHYLLVSCVPAATDRKTPNIHEILINTQYRNRLLATLNHNNYIFSQVGIIWNSNMSVSDTLAQPVLTSVPAHPCDWPFPTKRYLAPNPPLKCHIVVQSCTGKEVRKIEVMVCTATYSSALPLSQENTFSDYTEKNLNQQGNF